MKSNKEDLAKKIIQAQSLNDNPEVLLVGVHFFLGDYTPAVTQWAEEKKKHLTASEKYLMGLIYNKGC